MLAPRGLRTARSRAALRRGADCRHGGSPWKWPPGAQRPPRVTKEPCAYQRAPHEIMMQMRRTTRVLLTGTSLLNNFDELWAMPHLLP